MLTDEVLGDVTCLLAIFIRGPENLWSPWTGISASYPCATPLARALALGLALLVLRHSECCDFAVRLRKVSGTKKKDDPDWREKKSSCWLVAGDPKLPTRENGRRIEHFIGENEHL